MSPPSLDDSVPLAEEYLLCLELIELVKLGFDIVEFLPSLAGNPDLSRVDHELSLCVLEIRDLLIDRLDVVVSLRFVKQRLLCGQLLQGRDSLPLLQGGRPVILVNVDLLSRVLAVHRDKRDRRAHD